MRRRTWIPILIAVGLGGFFLKSRLTTHDEMAGPPDLQAKAETLQGTSVTPFVETPLSANRNVLWCSTFQLAWNELMDHTGGPIRLIPPVPMVTMLNKRSASKNDLDDASYVAKAGVGISDQIKAELDRKFPGQVSPDVLDAASKQYLIAFAYLCKELPFEHVFTRENQKLQFGNRKVDAFGVFQDQESDYIKEALAEQVKLLDYKNDNNFVLELKTRAEQDRLILAKILPGKTLKETIETVERRVVHSDAVRMDAGDVLEVPVLNFDILREYQELRHRTLRTVNGKLTGVQIARAMQSIRFRLDERGAVLKSYAFGERLADDTGYRKLIFNKPFLILLQRTNAKRPYFAVWVGNDELLVPTQPGNH